MFSQQLASSHGLRFSTCFTSLKGTPRRSRSILGRVEYILIYKCRQHYKYLDESRPSTAQYMHAWPLIAVQWHCWFQRLGPPGSHIELDLLRATEFQHSLYTRQVEEDLKPWLKNIVTRTHMFPLHNSLLGHSYLPPRCRGSRLFYSPIHAKIPSSQQDMHQSLSEKVRTTNRGMRCVAFWIGPAATCASTGPWKCKLVYLPRRSLLYTVYKRIIRKAGHHCTSSDMNTKLQQGGAAMSRAFVVVLRT